MFSGVVDREEDRPKETRSIRVCTAPGTATQSSIHIHNLPYSRNQAYIPNAFLLFQWSLVRQSVVGVGYDRGPHVTACVTPTLTF